MENIKLNYSFLTREIKIERVGIAFQLLKTKRKYERMSKSDSYDKLCDELPVDINYLKSLDPKEWKNQDHYAVLGLEKLR